MGVDTKAILRKGTTIEQIKKVDYELLNWVKVWDEYKKEVKQDGAWYFLMWFKHRYHSFINIGEQIADEIKQK